MRGTLAEAYGTDTGAWQPLTVRTVPDAGHAASAAAQPLSRSAVPPGSARDAMCAGTTAPPVPSRGPGPRGSGPGDHDGVEPPPRGFPEQGHEERVENTDEYGCDEEHVRDATRVIAAPAVARMTECDGFSPVGTTERCDPRWDTSPTGGVGTREEL